MQISYILLVLEFIDPRWTFVKEIRLNVQNLNNKYLNLNVITVKYIRNFAMQKFILVEFDISWSPRGSGGFLLWFDQIFVSEQSISK